MADAFMVELHGEGASWRLPLNAMPTWLAGDLHQAATELIYRLYSDLPRLPVELLTRDGAPLDPVATLEAQGFKLGHVVLVRFVSGKTRLAGGACLHNDSRDA
jgi:hypothetical protein